MLLSGQQVQRINIKSWYIPMLTGLQKTFDLRCVYADAAVQRPIVRAAHRYPHVRSLKTRVVHFEVATRHTCARLDVCSIALSIVRPICSYVIIAVPTRTVMSDNAESAQHGIPPPGSRFTNCSS